MTTDRLRATHLTTDRRIDPIGIGEPAPRLAWRLEGEGRGVVQAACQVQVAASAAALEQGHDLTWDSGRVEGELPAIAYGGPALRSRHRCAWRVRTWDDFGAVSAWSAPATFEMGLLEAGDWEARWIGYPARPPRLDVPVQMTSTRAPGLPTSWFQAPVPILRTTFGLPGPVRSARLYATAVGIYEAHVNGSRVGDEWLAPGCTDYRYRLQYQAYDVTGHLRAGENVLAMLVADGWAAEHVQILEGQHAEHPALLAQLEVELEDGSRLVVASDERWQARLSDIVSADLFVGESLDARLTPAAWDVPGPDDGGWANALSRSPVIGSLVAVRDEGVRVVAELAPASVTARGDGRYIVDAGQNVAGVVRLRVRNPAGLTVSLRHAEVLEADGELHTDGLGGAEQHDRYTPRGEPGEVFEPRFTQHGFRFVEVSGCEWDLRPDDVTILALSSAVTLTGSFACSDPLVNQLQSNITWGLRDNFISVPTDCPQRDERKGWTGDAQVFAATALFNADVAGTLVKWLDDVVDGQTPSGAYPDVAPVMKNPDDGWAGMAGWGDAGIIVPWQLYLETGDRQVLERLYPSMRRFLAFLRADNRDGNRSGGLFGDWLGLGAETPGDVVGTAYLAWSARLFAGIARVLGHDADAAEHAAFADRVADAFASAFVRPDGTIEGDTQTAYALALGFGLVPATLRAAAAGRLAALVEAAGVHLTTGFLGTPLLLPVLSGHGHHELACKLMRQQTNPSWLFQVCHGATTTWERWNSWTPEDGFFDSDMNSFNHYAYGAVGEWLYRNLAGLAPAEPGHRRTTVRPGPGGGFTWARASHVSPYGRHAVAWELREGGLAVAVEVPAGTSAEVIIDGPCEGLRVDGGAPLATAGVLGVTRADGETRLVLGSGCYEVLAPAG